MTDEKKAEKVIRRLDEQRRKHRVKRLMEFGKVAGTIEIGKVSTVTITPPEGTPIQFLWGYIEEAQRSYLESNFRSCVFCCATAVEQILKYEIALSSDNFKSEIEKFEKELFTLGKLIGQLRKCNSKNERISKLKKFIKSLGWLNEARNAIATHPEYVSLEATEDNEEVKKWKVKKIVSSIKRILSLLPEDEQKEVSNSKIEVSPERFITFKEFLDKSPQTIYQIGHKFIGRSELQLYLALEAFRKMKEIVEGVYPP